MPASTSPTPTTSSRPATNVIPASGAEYASILDLWLDGARKPGSIEPAAVLEGMKSDGLGAHAFGEAKWWGKDLFGIDNALVGNWPVVQIQNGRAVIVEFKNIPDWWSEFGEVVIRRFEEMGEMWCQRD